MKKITFLLSFLMMSVMASAQTVTLSHSADSSTFVGSVACAGGGTTADNQFFRSYVPSDFGVADNFQIEGAEFGFTFSEVSAGAVVTVIVRAYTVDGAFPGGALTEIAATTATLGAAEDGTLVAVAFDAPFPTVGIDDEIVIELNIPDNVDPEMYDARIGANDAGQTAPSYLSSTACGLTAIGTFDAIGFPDNHIVLNLTGSDVLGVNDAALSAISVFPNPATDVLNINVPSTIDLETATLYDVLGKVTNVSLSNGQINVANLARGVYILNVETSAGTLTEKVIIE